MPCRVPALSPRPSTALGPYWNGAGGFGEEDDQTVVFYISRSTAPLCPLCTPLRRPRHPVCLCPARHGPTAVPHCRRHCRAHAERPGREGLRLALTKEGAGRGGLADLAHYRPWAPPGPGSAAPPGPGSGRACAFPRDRQGGHSKQPGLPAEQVVRARRQAGERPADDPALRRRKLLDRN